jgi:hypothetical protein
MAGDTTTSYDISASREFRLVNFRPADKRREAIGGSHTQPRDHHMFNLETACSIIACVVAVHPHGSIDGGDNLLVPYLRGRDLPNASHSDALAWIAFYNENRTAIVGSCS